ncbi:ORF92 [White spot syndrome virus]|uniref:ORF92 n=1 Tax=White spot syndrome virus TaxID=342409 RepID=A0A2D3I6D8_9VIRU|nr:ORF92 [White spot syndrome virus]
MYKHELPLHTPDLCREFFIPFHILCCKGHVMLMSYHFISHISPKRSIRNSGRAFFFNGRSHVSCHFFNKIT